ncbi:MAG: hypothetical protein KZQ57_00410 [gamma proteobacterium symbiont of Lucinoma myriamae]|nr:hypothetical protein [gamma proteobacterium symbiont of Lucinoma myriamae]
MLQENNKYQFANHIQKQFWLLDQQGAGVECNVVSAFHCIDLDQDAFLRAVEEVFARYDSLNVCFAIEASQVVQKQNNCKPFDAFNKLLLIRGLHLNSCKKNLKKHLVSPLARLLV